MESALRPLASVVPAIVLELDREGIVRYANEYLEEVTGFHPDQVVGKHWLNNFVPEHDRTRITDVFQIAVSGTPTRGNINDVITRDGGRRSVQWNDRPLLDELGDTIGVLAVGVDVTEQLHQHQEIERSRSLLAEAQRMARIGVWEYDYRSDELWWSAEIAGLFGLDPDDTTPSYGEFMSVVHPDDRSLVVGAYRRMLDDHQPYRVAHRLLPADGSTMWVEERVVMDVDGTGRPVLARGTIQDITERLQLSRELALKDAALENASTPILIGDARYRLIYANTAFLRAWRAADLDEVLRSSSGDLWSYEGGMSQEEVRAQLSGGSPWNGPVRAFRFDGTEFPAELAGALIFDEAGEVSHVIGSFTDLTDRVEADRVKSEFLSMVSHELRTPLTAIDGALRLVTGGVVGPIGDDARQYLTAAQRNTRRLTHLIDQLLISERIAAGQFAVELGTHDLRPLVVGLVEAHQPYGADRSVRVEIDGEVPDVAVVTDDERLEQVLTNIVSNAIKFSPDDEAVVVRVTADEVAARVEVTDRGPGIPPASRELIFERFTQLDGTDSRAQGGTGLGLSIAKALSDQLGARIELESSEGDGSTFTVEIPLAEAGATSRGEP